MKKNIFIFILIIFGFTESFSTDYFWVGGSGNWSEISHWAIASGSTTTHLVVPTQDDNVYFDANSFSQNGSIVKINSSAVCKSMNWTGATNNPTLAGDFNNLRIYGSLTLINAMYLTFAGQIYFESINNGNTIRSAGKQLKYNVTFNGTGGGWTLQDGLDVTGNISLINGNLYTNNQPVSCSRFVSNNTNIRTLNLGSSVITLTGNGNNPEWNINSSYFSFTAGSSKINFTGSATNVIPGNGLIYYFMTFKDSSSTHTLNDSSSYRRVEFKGGGLITKNNFFDTLIFSPGKVYELDSSRIQIIGSELKATGNCTGSIIIRSRVPGFQTILAKTSGSVNVDYVTLKDCYTQGLAVFTARNSVDLGNNNGWFIFRASPLNLYWVGDGGNWTDPSHWSLTSGGTGGACIPNAYDNVFFDANSFSSDSQTVMINTSSASCSNMKWTGAAFNPILDGANNTSLSIYGSLELSRVMSLKYSGLVYFEAQSVGNTILSRGKQFINNVVFNGSGGEWSLLDSIDCASSIILVNGTLRTNDETVTCERFVSDGNKTRGLSLGSSLVTLIGSGKNAQWNFNDTKLTFDAGTSTIRFIGNDVSMFSGNGLTYYNVEFFDPKETYSLYSASTFNKVTFFGNGIIFDNNVYNNLVFSPGKSYILYSNSVQTINNSLSASGTCAAPISIRSTTPGSFATIEKSTGSISVNYVSLKDIHTQGAATFVANNSVDLGNNTGWTINSTNPKNLYWVGGTGNWSDGSHWSLTSGGIGGTCIPTGIDNVFFDANSFKMLGQSVYLDSRNAACNNMNWTGSTFQPTFAGDSVDIRIFGSLAFIPDMNITYNGQYIFESSNLNQNITTGMNPMPSNMIFEGVGGSWYIQDGINTTGMIFHYNGILNTNSKPVTASHLISDRDNVRSLVLGNSKITLTGSGTNPEWYLLDRNLFFNCGKSEIIFTGTDLAMVSGKGMKYNEVEFTNAATNVQLYDSASYNKVIFRGNGRIYNSSRYDTLTFSPGKTYILNSGNTQYIGKQFNVRGNNCFPIVLRASSSGQQAYVYQNTGIVSGDFIEMSDMQATGGATFYAGKFSKDIANNTNWLFNNSPGYIYGLGPDLDICPGEIIKTNNFNGAISYLWQDGSTDSVYTITQPGTYWVVATYANNCRYTDTIVVSMKPTPVVDAGRDTVFCQGDIVSVRMNGSATGGITPYQSIRWTPATGLSNPTSLTPLATPSVTTSYELAVTGANGCVGRDTMTISINPNVVLEFQNVEDTLDFKPVCVTGTSDTLLTIHNASQGETTILADINPTSLFSLDNNPMSIKFAPDETKNIRVRSFGNGNEGNYTGKLTFTDVCNNVKTIELSSFIFQPSVSFNDTLDFGTICINQSASTRFSITNSSSRATSFSRKIDSTSMFSLMDYSLTNQLNQGESRDVPIFFKGSTNEGIIIDSLIVIDTCGNSKKLALKANIFLPKIDVKDTIDFGDVCINNQKTVTFDVTNTSILPTSFLTNNYSGLFSVIGNTFASNFNVNETRTANLRFNGSSASGILNDSLQIIDTCGGVKNVVLLARIVDPQFNADSTSLLIDSVDNGTTATRRVVLRNNGNAVVHVDSISTPPQLFGISNINPALPVDLSPGDSIVFTLSFFADDDLLHTFDLIVYASQPCQLDETIPVSAKGNPVTAKAYLEIPTDSALVGTQVTIPILLKSSTGLIESGITGYTIRVSTDRTVLKSRGNTPQGTFVNNRRIIQLSGTLRDTIGTLAQLQFIPALGEVECSSVEIDTVIWTGGLCRSYITNGQFCIAGLCREGGARLISPGQITLFDAKPNPANDKITFEFEIIEEAATSLIITDMLGRKNEILFESIPLAGRYKMDYSTNSLENGIYMFTLKTPTVIKTKFFSIVR
ncbi:MAG: hypothetical protein EPN82_15785 [Bacteroidetes bacterium]|nr:MAG: hypothetical protein EPN82_15785 [Bacteroidota bacterium]